MEQGDASDQHDDGREQRGKRATDNDRSTRLAAKRLRTMSEAKVASEVVELSDDDASGRSITDTLEESQQSTTQARLIAKR